MRWFLLVSMSALGLLACTPKSEPAAPAAPTALATYPSPTFLENLVTTADGALYFTNYTGKAVEVLRPDAPVAVFAQLDAYPVSILPLGEGYLVVAHGASFADGPAFIGTSKLLVLDASGKVTSTIPAPQAGFLNGMLAAADGSILIADSVKSQILRFDPASGALTTWFADPLLAPQTEPDFRPGANGLKATDGGLIVSSSAQKALYKIAIGPDSAPSGGLTPIVTDLPGADDFAPLPEGGFVVATHSDRVVRVGADGAISTITDDPRIRGNTAVALQGSGPDRRVVILGTGGFSEGLKGDAVVLAAPLPE